MPQAHLLHLVMEALIRHIQPIFHTDKQVKATHILQVQVIQLININTTHMEHQQGDTQPIHIPLVVIQVNHQCLKAANQDTQCLQTAANTHHNLKDMHHHQCHQPETMDTHQQCQTAVQVVSQAIQQCQCRKLLQLTPRPQQ